MSAIRNQLTILTLGLLLVPAIQAAEQSPDYSKQVAPILKKYCAGCHNDQDQEGKLSLESFAALQRGGETGAALLPGDANSSRLIRLVTGQAKPLMPPEDNKRPTAEEIALLKAWIDAGAKGPAGAEPDLTHLLVPQLKPAAADKPITAVSWSPTGRMLAVARYGKIELRNARNGKTMRTLVGLPGKINAVEFSKDGKQLLSASGIAGLYGVATVWNVQNGKPVRQYKGHRDTMYAATLSPDGKTLATSSYDHQIILWNAKSGEQLRKLTGHNGAVYDVAFHPGGQVLASASGDETVKLWRVDTGLRLDTRSEPLDEQYVVTFSPDGKYLVAGGADNRIRVWQFISETKPKINPLVYSRYAHEGPIVQLAFAPNGQGLLTGAEDRTLKLWETEHFTQVFAYESQSDVAPAMAVAPGNNAFVVARMDGSLKTYPLKLLKSKPVETQQTVVVTTAKSETPRQEFTEKEPNDTPSQALQITVPANVKGTIDLAGDDRLEDQDLYRFTSKAGEQWIVEVNAARSKSPLDSRIEVLTAEGERIERVILEAVRDSYFTFRGKDSNTSNDYRVHNWREMELNEYLYADGEVVKLWLYPRGPDSGFKVYPGTGSRYAYFDTTPTTHALNSPCYIVRPHAPGTKLIPSGLPVFPIYYENDDESRRELGSDSRLTFTAPADGQYLVRVVDARGFQGEKFAYTLTVRPRRPDFTVSVGGMNPKVSPGSGREFSVKAKRKDGFQGPIHVHVKDLPKGFHVATPLVIEAEQNTALGTITAMADAPKPAADAKPPVITASAQIDGQTVTKDVGNLGKVELAAKPKVVVHVEQATGDAAQDWSVEKPLELEIQPGTTIMAKVRVDRNDFKGRISFGGDDSGRNLPHGVYVDNIGLNGLLIVEGKNERNFFITAAKWVPEMTRTFHLRATVDGNQTSIPVILHVRPPK